MLNFLNLKKETFGLDISDLSLKIAKIKKNKKFLKLVSFGEAPINPGIIEGGEIKNEEALSRAIKEAVSAVSGEKLETKYVVASLPEEKSFLQVIQLPKMKDEELIKAVKFEAENYIPLPIEDVYLDFQAVHPPRAQLDHVDVLIAAISKKIVDSYVSSIKGAGLIPFALEVESQAISRALIKNEISPFPVLLIDLGATRTSFIIFSGYSMRFTSTIPIASQQFTDSISKAMNINIKEAERLKKKYGLDISKKISFRKKLQGIGFKREILEDKKVFDVLVPPIMDLIRYIKKYLDYYQNHVVHEHISPNDKSVKKILLCGGGANLKGFADILSLELKIPVETGNPWINILPNNLQELPEISYEDSLSYAISLGLAMRAFREK